MNIPEGATHQTETNGTDYYLKDIDFNKKLALIWSNVNSEWSRYITIDGINLRKIEKYNPATDCQQIPKGQGRAITSLVMEDLIKRTEKGIETYGEALRADNGRDALVDAYQEALDLAMYLRQAIEERQQ